MADRFLSFEERKVLNRIVSELYVFTDGGGRDRRIFLQENAGLGRFVKGINLSGPAQTFVADLIGRLEQYGDLSERPAFHALGALLDASLEQGDMPNADRILVAGLIVRYALVSDPVYLERLRSQYRVETSTIREPGSTLTLPQSGVADSDPSFTAALSDENALEAIIDSEDNFLDINFLYGAIYCSHAVCLIESPVGVPRGTAFLINHDVLLTNYHVIRNSGYLEEGVARFGYRLDYSGARTNGKIVKLDPGFYFSSPAEELDYAMVRLVEAPLAHMVAGSGLEELSVPELVMKGVHRGYLTLVDSYIRKHDRVNIIQHPDGDPLKVVMTRNFVDDDMAESRVRYVADTMKGSSGSPVLNHRWQVVALHHSGKPYPPDSGIETRTKDWRGRYRLNEGIPVRAILNDFRAKGLVKYIAT